MSSITGYFVEIYPANPKSRLNQAAHIPLSLFTRAFDTLLGVELGIANLASGGTNQKLHEYTFSCLEKSEYLLSSGFEHLLTVLNPDLNPESRNGLFTKLVQDAILQKGEEWKKKEGVLHRHVFSRFAYVGYALASLATRIVDFVLGVIFAVPALIFQGKSDTFNSVALDGLRITGVIKDIFYGLTKCLNPWADSPEIVVQMELPTPHSQEE